MFIVNSLLTISMVVSLLLGLFVILGNPKRAINRSLAGFCIAIFLWLLANLATNLSADPGVALIFAKGTLLGVSLMALTFVLFCESYVQYTKLNFTRALKWSIVPLFLLLFAPTSLNVESIGPNGTETVTGKLYFLITPILLIYFAWGISLLVKHYKTAKSLLFKSQLRYVFAGFVLTFIPAIISNAILPSLGNNTAVLFGPNAVVFLAIFMTLGIVKHQLLDIRLIVARSLAYILLLSSIIVFYGLFVYLLASKLFDNNRLAEQVVPLIGAIILAFTIQPLKSYFDRLTSKYFYRDAYDSQAFLDNFNKILVSTYDLKELLKKSALIIEENLKPTYTVFGIKETTNTPQRIIGTSQCPSFSSEHITYVRSITTKMKRKLIITDTLEDQYVKLQEVLQQNNIAMIARLAAKNNEEGSGYLILGPKKSGNLYSPQDNKIIEIIANELVIAIQNAVRFEEIQNFNITLQEKISDATRRIRRTNEKLKQIDETKDDFISMASHQLRTPLTSVKGYISMVLEEDAGKITPMQREMLGQAFFSSQRMVYLIADLLNVSRLKTGKFIIERIPIQLDQIVMQELRQLQETAAARSLTLQFDQPKAFPSMMLDETKTRQIIMNFIDNAIYYTPAGGHINVRLVNNPNSIELRVEDNGIGVPKAEQAHLFTKFYRAGNARQARPDGTGLGLYMAKKVIVAQGGSLLFTSEEGKGSTFGFVFSKKFSPDDDLTAPELLLQDIQVTAAPEPLAKT